MVLWPVWWQGKYKVNGLGRSEWSPEDITDHLSWATMTDSQYPSMTGAHYLSPYYLGILVCQKQHLFCYLSSCLSEILSPIQSAVWRPFILEFIVNILHKNNKCIFNIIDFIFCFACEEPWTPKGLNNREYLSLPSNFKSYDHALGFASLWSI